MKRSHWNIRIFCIDAVLLFPYIVSDSYWSRPPLRKRPQSPTRHSCFSSKEENIESLEYIETTNEKWLRHLWESSPFQVADHIVLGVLHRDAQYAAYNFSTATKPFLQPVNREDRALNIDDLFSAFYSCSTSSPVPEPEKTVLGSKRQSFRLHLAYDGRRFCGWQRQGSCFEEGSLLPSVQATIENAIEASWFWGIQKDHRPDVRVAGRTDAGVHAVGQVARLRVLRGPMSGSKNEPVSSSDVFQSLEDAAASANFTWRCLSVVPESETFHPTFGTKERSYVYMIDAESLLLPYIDCLPTMVDGMHNVSSIVKRMDRLLYQIQGNELDFMGFSYGKVKTQTTLCTLNIARARLLQETMPSEGKLVVAIELSGDRFLRRMVRILVATTLSLALVDEASDFDVKKLLTLCTSKNRELTMKAAPPGGLIFVSAKH